MSLIKDFIHFLSGFRKLLLAALVLALIVGLSIIVLGIFVVNWYLGTAVLTGEQLVDLYKAAFKYSAAVAGSYMAANVAVKGIKEWLAKKK